MLQQRGRQLRALGQERPLRRVQVQVWVWPIAQSQEVNKDSSHSPFSYFAAPRTLVTITTKKSFSLMLCCPTDEVSGRIFPA